MKADGIDLIDNSEITREFIDNRGTEFPTEPTNAQVFQLTAPVSDKLPGIYVYSEAQSDWIIQEDDEKQPYDIGMTVIGRPKPSAIVANYIAVRTASIYANFDKSLALAQEAATDQATFNLRIIDRDGNVVRELGTIVFEANAKDGVFSATAPGDMLIQRGEIVSLKAPEVRDATLKEISITIAGQLAVLKD
mgnify:FL=1